VEAAAGVLLILLGWAIGAFGLALLVGAGIGLQQEEPLARSVEMRRSEKQGEHR
jgi:hypothetical protein